MLKREDLTCAKRFIALAACGTTTDCPSGLTITILFALADDRNCNYSVAKFLHSFARSSLRFASRKPCFGNANFIKYRCSFLTQLQYIRSIACSFRHLLYLLTWLYAVGYL